MLWKRQFMRQIAAIGAALLIGVPTGVLGGRILPENLVFWCVIIPIVPIGFWGFKQYKDMWFEEYAVLFFKVYLGFEPQKRVYEDTGENYFVYLQHRQAEQGILGQLAANGELDGYGDEDDLEWEIDGYVR